jgi:streptogramin lyase
MRTGAIAKNGSGDDILCTVPDDDDARVNVINLRSRQLDLTLPMTGSSGSPAMTTSTDGSVYIGTYLDGRLYRYDPSTETIEDLGAPVAGETYVYALCAGPDGKVYGGTYGNSHVFEYDPATGAVIDFGSLSTTERYVRGIAYDLTQQVVFAGLQGDQGRLMKIDVAAGDVADVTPDGLDTGISIGKLWWVAGRLFLAVSGRLYAFDPITMQGLQFTDADTGQQSDCPDGTAVGQISSARDGVVFACLAEPGKYYLKKIELDTLTVSTALSAGGPAILTGKLGDAPIAIGWGTGESGQPMLYGLAGNYTGHTFAYDPQAELLEQWTSPLRSSSATALRNVLAGEAGTSSEDFVYVSAGPDGATGAYNRVSGDFDSSALDSSAIPRLGQVEGWAWGGGKIYAGVYPYALLTAWDPAAPVSSTNPHELFRLQDDYQQNRPYAVLATDTAIYVGTSPDYGYSPGALSIYDLTSDSLTVYKDIVQDQTVASLLVRDGTLYGGSSINNSNGGQPVATDAKLFTFDLAAGEKTGEYALFSGVSAINALTLGPDGDVWGLADGTIFVLDPRDQSVAWTIEVVAATSGPQEGDMIWHSNGYLYVVTHRTLYAVNPLSGAVETVHARVGRASLGPDDSIYLTYQPEDRANITDLARYDPPSGAQSPVDLRRSVFVGTVDSGVLNRFTSSGATLADLIPDDRLWASARGLVDAMTAKIRTWQRSGLINGGEAQALLDAARRSHV